MGWHSCLFLVCDKTPVDAVEAGLLLYVFNCLSPESTELLGNANPFHQEYLMPIFLAESCVPAWAYFCLFITPAFTALCKSSGDWDEHLKPGEGKYLGI